MNPHAEYRHLDIIGELQKKILILSGALEEIIYYDGETEYCGAIARAALTEAEKVK